jgi:cytochrome P450
MTNPSPNAAGSYPIHGPAVPLFGDDFRRDPHAVLHALAVWAPVVRVELEPGVHAFLATDYQTILQICRDPETYSRDSRQWRDYARGRITHTSELLQMMTYRENVLFADGPRHARLRRAITDSLDRVDLGVLENDVRRIANQLIDMFVSRGHADLVREFTDMLPLLVCIRLFGLRNDNGFQLLDILARIWDGTGADRAGRRLHRLLGDLIAEKRQRPGADLTTSLLRHRAGLSDEELLEQLVLIIGASNTPTSALLGNTLQILLTDEQTGRDVGGHRITVEQAIHRALWLKAPFTAYPFVYPTEDVTFGDVTVPAGSPIALGLAAANSSMAARFTRPRGDSRAHLAFGVGDSPHGCPAKVQALRIATTAIETLLTRLSGLRLAVPADDLKFRPSVFAGAYSALPVEFTPQAISSEGGSTCIPRPSSLIRPVPATTPQHSAPGAQSRRFSFPARRRHGR